MENGDESFPAKTQVVALPHGKLQSCGFAVLTSFQGLKTVTYYDKKVGWATLPRQSSSSSQSRAGDKSTHDRCHGRKMADRDMCIVPGPVALAAIAKVKMMQSVGLRPPGGSSPKPYLVGLPPRWTPNGPGTNYGSKWPKILDPA